MTYIRFGALIVMVVVALAAGCAAQDAEDHGYLDRPPVFIDSLHDFPLAGMGTGMPQRGNAVPAFDLVSLESDGFKRNGADVQPSLRVKYDTLFAGAVYGLNRQWAAELIVPWTQVDVDGGIGGFPASGTVDGIGGVCLGGKRLLWSRWPNRSLVATGLLQLPNGFNRGAFDQSNTATNSYFQGYPRRMPLSWQPSSGTWNGYLALAYGQSMTRLSYVGLLATKLHSADDEDAKVGDIFVLAGSATYGVAKRLALSLGMTLRVQADDSYPQAPPPGIDQPLLAGTTQHGTTLYLDPSVRFIVGRSIAVGLGVRLPVIEPDDGLVPRTKLNIIFYPGL